MTLVPVIYEGGLYRHDEIVELIDDLGGYIIQKQIVASDVFLQSLVPREDIELIRAAGKPLGGDVRPAPLVGTEIAVVSPSLEIHHLPHSSCDVAEYLRRYGAKTNMVGLARGFGKRVAKLSIEERDVINEHDLAVYVLGNFAECIEYKFPALRRGVEVPIVLLGAPPTETLREIVDPPVAGYLGGMGRLMHRWKRGEEIALLEDLVDLVAGILDQTREEIAKDPLSISPARLMDSIMDAIPELEYSTHPTPITVRIDGLRVKIPYDAFAGELRSLEIEEGVTIGDICTISQSRMRNYINLQILPYSETTIMV
ncbi:MAG: methanogenesis marker 7 protein [Methanomicrobiales archaeon]